MPETGSDIGLQGKQYVHRVRVRNGNKIDENVQSIFILPFNFTVVIPTSDFALFTSYVSYNSGYSAVQN